jgi:hypothetical protein
MLASLISAHPNLKASARWIGGAATFAVALIECHLSPVNRKGCGSMNVLPKMIEATLINITLVLLQGRLCTGQIS